MISKLRLLTESIKSKTLVGENSYFSPITGTTRFYAKLERHEVGVALNFQLRWSGGPLKKSHTREIDISLSRDALQALITHLQEGLK